MIVFSWIYIFLNNCYHIEPDYTKLLVTYCGSYKDEIFTSVKEAKVACSLDSDCIAVSNQGCRGSNIGEIGNRTPYVRLCPTKSTRVLTGEKLDVNLTSGDPTRSAIGHDCVYAKEPRGNSKISNIIVYSRL